MSDFKLGIGDEIKADRDWRGVGLPQVAMHRICHIFCFYFVLIKAETGIPAVVTAVDLV